MIAPVKHPIVTSPYGPRILNGKAENHQGIDMISGIDDKSVYSILPGKVILDFDQYVHQRRFSDKKMSAGNYVCIQYEFNNTVYYVRYLHLSENFVALGGLVDEGERIGLYGDVGYSFGAHLHFEVYDKTWKLINPIEIAWGQSWVK